MVDPSADPTRDPAPVSVEDHERLLQDVAALREQFEAADEVLSAMGRSATDPDTVLSTIVASARRLCRSDAAHLYLLHEGVYQLNQTIGISEDAISYIAEHPLPPRAPRPNAAPRRSPRCVRTGTGSRPRCRGGRAARGSGSRRSARHQTVVGVRAHAR